MDLSNLKPAEGSKHSKKRVGRGQGTGQGVQAGRGHKGAKARVEVRDRSLRRCRLSVKAGGISRLALREHAPLHLLHLPLEPLDPLLGRSRHPLRCGWTDRESKQHGRRDGESEIRTLH